MKNDFRLEKNNKEIQPKEKKKAIEIKAIMSMDLGTLKVKLSKRLKKINKLSTPEKKRKVVAFDMGSSVIKIVEGMYYKEELTIDKYITMRTPKDAIVDGEIRKSEELFVRLAEVLKENGIKAKYAVCTNNSTLIINREILIPKVEEEEIDTVVRYEIQQYLPINLQDYILQVTILDEEETNEAKKLNVRVIAYPEKIARGYYELLLKLNLKPYALDVNYNAVNKFINCINKNNEYDQSDSVAYIDMGASFIDVNIYKNQQLDFTRMIKDCGNEIDEMLKERNGLNSKEVGTFKKKNIDLMEELEPANVLAREIVDEWIEKIEKIIQFYKNRNIGNQVRSIVIFGGSSNLNGMEKYMTEKLRIKTKIKGISKIAFKSNDDGEPIDGFINAIGSLIRSYKMQDLNFFKPYIGRNKEKKDVKIYFYIAYGILVLAIVTTLVFNLVKIMILNREIKDYNEKLNAPEMQTQLKEAKELSDKMDVLNEYEGSLSDVAKAVAKNDVVTDDLLNDISGGIPKDVSFKDFKIEGYTLSIKGVTHTRAAIGEFEHNLRELSEIKNVQVDKIDKSNTVGEDYSFEMTCVLKEVK